MIAVTVIGAETVQANLAAGPSRARAALSATTMRLATLAQRKVMSEKLTGQVLHVRTGRLRRSINVRDVSSGDTIGAATGTNVNYGRIWELTGFGEHEIIPRIKKALFWKGARHPVRRVVVPAQAPRPFLLPVLAEMRAQAKAEMTAAVTGAF